MTRNNETRFHFKHVTKDALSTPEIIKKKCGWPYFVCLLVWFVKKGLLREINVGVATGYNPEMSKTDPALLNGSSYDDSGGDEVASKVKTPSRKSPTRAANTSNGGMAGGKQKLTL